MDVVEVTTTSITEGRKRRSFLPAPKRATSSTLISSSSNAQDVQQPRTLPASFQTSLMQASSISLPAAPSEATTGIPVHRDRHAGRSKTHSNRTASQRFGKGLQVGARVLIAGIKPGILRYLGPTHLASGVFCGIELFDPDGNHDGSVNGRRYFVCMPNHGIFAPHEKVCLDPSHSPGRYSSDSNTFYTATDNVPAPQKIFRSPEHHRYPSIDYSKYSQFLRSMSNVPSSESTSSTDLISSRHPQRPQANPLEPYRNIPPDSSWKYQTPGDDIRGDVRRFHQHHIAGSREGDERTSALLEPRYLNENFVNSNMRQQHDEDHKRFLNLTYDTEELSRFVDQELLSAKASYPAVFKDHSHTFSAPHSYGEYDRHSGYGGYGAARKVQSCDAETMTSDEDFTLLMTRIADYERSNEAREGAETENSIEPSSSTSSKTDGSVLSKGADAHHEKTAETLVSLEDERAEADQGSGHSKRATPVSAHVEDSSQAERPEPASGAQKTEATPESNTDQQSSRATRKEAGDKDSNKSSRTEQPEQPQGPAKTRKHVVITKTRSENVDHQMPNTTRVTSRLADYIKAPVPVKTREEIEAKKKQQNKASKNVHQRTSSLMDSGRAAVSTEHIERVRPERVEKPKPIIKRAPPKSKWGNIMSQIEANKDTAPVKLTEVKSSLAAYLSTPPPLLASPGSPDKEGEAGQQNRKEIKSKLKPLPPPPPKIDLTKVKSKLNVPTAASASKVLPKREHSSKPAKAKSDSGHKTAKSSSKPANPEDVTNQGQDNKAASIPKDSEESATVTSLSETLSPLTESHGQDDQLESPAAPSVASYLEVIPLLSEDPLEQVQQLQSMCLTRGLEISRLELELTKVVQAFDVMAVLFNYCSNEKYPELERQMEECVLEALDLAQERADSDNRKSANGERPRRHLASKQGEAMNNLTQFYERQIEMMRQAHERQLADVTNEMKLDMNAVKISHLEEIEQMRSKQDEQMEELRKQHKGKIEDLTERFETVKISFQDKIDSLRKECEDLAHTARTSQEALQRDSDVKVRIALAPYLALPSEIESLKSVQEMRLLEIQKLRARILEIENQLEEIPIARDKIISLQQKIENLVAMMAMKSEREKQLHEKCQVLIYKYEREYRAHKRIALDYEQMMWRMTQSCTELTPGDSLSRQHSTGLSHSQELEQDLSDSQEGDDQLSDQWEVTILEKPGGQISPHLHPDFELDSAAIRSYEKHSSVARMYHSAGPELMSDHQTNSSDWLDFENNLSLDVTGSDAASDFETANPYHRPSSGVYDSGIYDSMSRSDALNTSMVSNDSDNNERTATDLDLGPVLEGHESSNSSPGGSIKKLPFQTQGCYNRDSCGPF